MRFGSATRVLVVLAVTAAMAQSVLPGTTPGAPILNRQSPAGRRGQAANKTADPQGLAAMRQQVADMESTLSQMRVVLKEMQAKAAKSKTTDSLTKANLGLWDLMVGHLDKELQQLRVTLAEREDLEVRRAALYKQADANAEAKAQAARAAQAARFAEAQKNATGTVTPAATEPVTGQTAPQSPASQTAPAPPSAPTSTPNPASPN
jgi:septal ring factor EnvC (AmiA/AmiB activator)